MIPTFENQEYLIVDELSYFLREPKRGEVIVFRYPLDSRQFFMCFSSFLVVIITETSMDSIYGIEYLHTS